MFTLCLFLLCMRLYSLSCSDKNRALEVLEGQYTSRITAVKHDGFVYDRNMSIISHKQDVGVLLVDTEKIGAEKENALLLEEYAKSLGRDDIFELLSDGIPFTLAVNVTPSLEQTAAKTEGLYLYKSYTPTFDTAVHFLGYTDINGDGVTGLRASFNRLLRQDLSCRAEGVFQSDAKNKSMSEMKVYDDGYNNNDGIITTLDKGLQNFTDSLCDEMESGCIIAARADTGEILALSSFPAYDSENIMAVLDSDKGELLNRAFCSFTPGSVFKIAVCMAALEKDESLYEFSYECTGEQEVDGNVFRCHNRNGHGKQTMDDAFANSCNTYFINLAEQIGLDAIIDIMKRLELDQKTKADFLCEVSSFFPDENNKDGGHLANISFGQGELCLSPADMTKLVICASTGKNTALHTVRGKKEDGITELCGFEDGKRVLKSETVERLLFMMEKCVVMGTGKSAQVKGVRLGGKTATAQTGKFDGEGVEYVHKWFCGVYPAGKPRIVVCVLKDFQHPLSQSPNVVFAKICKYLDENGF